MLFDIQTVGTFLKLWGELDDDVKDRIPASMLEAVGALRQAYKAICWKSEEV